MNALIRLSAVLALVLTVAPAALFAAGKMDDGAMKATMLVGALLWFAVAPLWLKGGD